MDGRTHEVGAQTLEIASCSVNYFHNFRENVDL
jgi:hypothetical protein